MAIPDNTTEFIQNNRVATKIVKIPEVKTRDIFECKLDKTINPHEFCTKTLTRQSPWHVHAIPWKKTYNTTFWIVNASLLHIHNNNVTETSDIQLQITPTKVTIIIPYNASSHRVAEFITTLDEKVGISKLSSQTQHIERDKAITAM